MNSSEKETGTDRQTVSWCSDFLALQSLKNMYSGYNDECKFSKYNAYSWIKNVQTKKCPCSDYLLIFSIFYYFLMSQARYSVISSCLALQVSLWNIVWNPTEVKSSLFVCLFAVVCLFVCKLYVLINISVSCRPSVTCEFKWTYCLFLYCPSLMQSPTTTRWWTKVSDLSDPDNSGLLIKKKISPSVQYTCLPDDGPHMTPASL